MSTDIKNEVMSLNAADFSFVYESQGYTFLFEDVISKAYWLDSNVIFYDGISGKVYSPTAVIEKFRKEGRTRTSEQTKNAIASLDLLVEQAFREMDGFVKKSLFLREHAAHMFFLIENICKGYLWFDPFYWDDAYELAATNADMKENIALVQSYKNEIREKMDPIFFDADGYWGVLLIKVGERYAIPVADLYWYTKDEILGLFDDAGKKVPESALQARKSAYLFYQNDMQQNILLEGAEATAVIKKFTQAAPPATETSVQGKVAHGKGKVVAGRVRIITRDYSNPALTRRRMAEMNQGDVLVSETTDPELMEALRKAGAIVTDVGGMLSHAAITARELDTPCVVSTKNATKVFKDGDMVEVDANSGIVKIIK